MQVALVGRYFNRQGGVSRCLAELAERCSEQHQTVVFTHEILDARPSQIDFRRLKMRTRPRFLQQPAFGLAAWREVTKGSFDIVHAEGPQSLRADIYTAHSTHAAWLAHRRHGAGLAGLASHAYPPHLAALAWERQCFTGSGAHVVAVSRLVERELIEHLSIDPKRITVIYNGVDTEAFRPPIDRQVSRLVYSEDEDAVILAFVAYEFAKKGLRQLIEAAARLRGIPLRILVAGREDPSAFAALASDLGIERQVAFLGHRPDVVPILQAADALVLPTRYEAFGLVITEALACGTPVIVTAIAGAAELIEDGRQGLLLANAFDVDELEQRLRDFVAQRANWSRMREQARTLANEWSWDKVWARTNQLYETVHRRKCADQPAPR